MSGWFVRAARALTLIVCASVATTVSSCGARTESPAGTLTITLKPADASTAAVVRVTGLSSQELQSLGQANLDQASWSSLFSVRVAGPDVPAVVGRYTVADEAVEFRPMFPFDAGRSYTARFDPARLPTPRSEPVVEQTIGLAAIQRTPSTVVTAIYPSSHVWPENMLRFYVHLSAPMRRTGGVHFIHVMDADGEEVPDALLVAYSDLWNPDQTRLTVLFDPGRVKRGVGPNVAMGRALVAGRHYSISIDATWPDANGQPLKTAFKHEFLAAPALYGALEPKTWTLSPVRAGTRDPLTVSFGRPLDRALVDRGLGVARGEASLAGTTSIGSEEKTWTFTPDSPWQSGAHRLIVLTLLEDPVGNRVGKAFEVLSSDPTANAVAPDTVSVGFDVR